MAAMTVSLPTGAGVGSGDTPAQLERLILVRPMTSPATTLRHRMRRRRGRRYDVTDGLFRRVMEPVDEERGAPGEVPARPLTSGGGGGGKRGSSAGSKGRRRTKVKKKKDVECESVEEEASDAVPPSVADVKETSNEGSKGQQKGKRGSRRLSRRATQEAIRLPTMPPAEEERIIELPESPPSAVALGEHPLLQRPGKTTPEGEDEQTKHQTMKTVAVTASLVNQVKKRVTTHGIVPSQRMRAGSRAGAEALQLPPRMAGNAPRGRDGDIAPTVNGLKCFGLGKSGVTRAVVRFPAGPPAQQPLTLCFHFPATFLTHRYVLDMVRSKIHFVPEATVKTIQYIDRNTLHGTRGLDNRWLITVSNPEGRDELLRLGLHIYNRRITLRRLDDILMEEYKEYQEYLQLQKKLYVRLQEMAEVQAAAGVPAATQGGGPLADMAEELRKELGITPPPAAAGQGDTGEVKDSNEPDNKTDQQQNAERSGDQKTAADGATEEEGSGGNGKEPDSKGNPSEGNQLGDSHSEDGHLEDVQSAGKTDGVVGGEELGDNEVGDELEEEEHP